LCQNRLRLSSKADVCKPLKPGGLELATLLVAKGADVNAAGAVEAGANTRSLFSST